MTALLKAKGVLIRLVLLIVLLSVFLGSLLFSEVHAKSNNDRLIQLQKFSDLLLYEGKDRDLTIEEELENIQYNWGSTSLSLDASVQTSGATDFDANAIERDRIVETREAVLDNIQYRRLKQDSEYDIAVIIANQNYKTGKNIPDNDPAIRDGRAFEKFAKDGLGIKPGNIIWLKNASQAHFLRVFGSSEQHKGQLYDWVKKDRSRVYVYYAGHGAPASDNDSFLVPVDSDSARLNLNGYKISTLYKNLTKIPSKSTWVVLESCFSGLSQSGEIITNASPIYAQASSVTPPKGISVISAAKSNQIASWEPNGQQSLFTEYFLKGMSGTADKKPYGNEDGDIDWDELNNYLEETLTYWARRYYGRDQIAEIFTGG